MKKTVWIVLLLFWGLSAGLIQPERTSASSLYDIVEQKVTLNDVLINSVSINGGVAIVTGSGSTYVFERERPGGEWAGQKLTYDYDIYSVNSGTYVDNNEVMVTYREFTGDPGRNYNGTLVFRREKSGVWMQSDIIGGTLYLLSDNVGVITFSGEYEIIDGYPRSYRVVDFLTKDGAGKWVRSDGFSGWLYSEASSGDVLLTGMSTKDDIDYGIIWEKESSGRWLRKLILPGYYSSAAASNGIALFGKEYDDNSRGSVYVYERNNGGIWVEKQKLVANDGVTGNGFGHTMEILGNQAIIRDRTSTYIFERDAAGRWLQKQKLVANDGVAENYYCQIIGISGNQAIVRDRTSTYIFEQGATGQWLQKQKLITSDGVTGDFQFSDAGNRIFVKRRSWTGIVLYIFEKSRQTGQWEEKRKLTFDQGTAIAFSGNSIIVGAGNTVHFYNIIYL